MGKSAIPVGVTMAAEKDSHERVQRALLLPAVKQLGRPSTLITMHGIYREGAILHVYLPAGTIQIKLSREYKSEDLFNEFEYQQISQLNIADEDLTDTTSNKGSDDSFDDVWSSI